MDVRPQLLVLVGPKGSGKTTLGRMLEQRLHARLVAGLEELAHPSDDALLVIECTGAPSEAHDLGLLRERYELLYVRVHAERATCDARMAKREPATLPPERSARLYELANRVSLPWDLELDNDAGLDARSVADAVRPLLRAFS